MGCKCSSSPVSALNLEDDEIQREREHYDFPSWFKGDTEKVEEKAEEKEMQTKRKEYDIFAIHAEWEASEWDCVL